MASIWGYGAEGPYAARKAYDMLVQGETGLEATTGSEAEPARLGIPVADIGSGLYAALSILAALHARSLDGKGRAVEVSLFETMLDWMAQPLAQWVNSGVPFKRNGLGHHLLVPYSAFKTRDGVLINITCQQDSEWRSLCRVLRLEGLSDQGDLATFAGRRGRRPEVEAAVAAVVGSLEAVHLEALLDEGAIAHGRVRPVEEVPDHPQVTARGLIQDTGFGHLVGPVVSGAEPQRRPPRIGEHGPEILAGLGYSAEEVAALIDSGALKVS